MVLTITIITQLSGIVRVLIRCTELRSRAISSALLPCKVAARKKMFGMYMVLIISIITQLSGIVSVLMTMTLDVQTMTMTLDY